MDMKQSGKCIARLATFILVPERALHEPGYIQMMQDEGCGSCEDKHRYQALAQMAYFQFQDQELSIRRVSAPVHMYLQKESGDEVIRDGLCIGRGYDGLLVVVQIGEGNVKKLLETAHRYCTRWVRLDI